MRKTITLVAGAMMAMTVSAAPQTVTRVKVSSDRSTTMETGRLSPAQYRAARGGMVNGVGVLAGDVSTLKDLKLKETSPAGARAKADGEIPEVITDKPEGRDGLYSRSGDGLTTFFGFILQQPQNGAALETVTSTDGKTMWFKDFISSAITGTYISASVDGNKVTVPMGQCAIYWPSAGYGLKLGVGKLTEVTDDDGSYLTYLLDETGTSVTFTVSDGGVMTIEDKFKAADGETSEYVVAYFYTDDDSWSAYSNWNSVYTPFTGKAATIPEGVETRDYVMSSVNPDPYYGGVKSFRMLRGGVKDGKFYIAGINPDEPDNTLVGTVDGSKVTFAGNQYLGISYGYFCYAVGSVYELVYDEYYDEYSPVYSLTDGLTFNLDGNGTLTPADADTALLLNAGRADSDDDISTLEQLGDVTFKVFHNVAATPAMPSINYFEDDFDSDGFIGVLCTVPTMDSEGEYINPDNLYYILWNGIEGGDMRPYVFYAEDYPAIRTELGKDMIIEVPYDFESLDWEGDYGINAAGSQIILREEAPDLIGLQSVYYGGGQRHVSDIAWYYTSHVRGVAGNEARVVAVYGIDGVRRDISARGINIVKMSDGSFRKVMVK